MNDSTTKHTRRRLTAKEKMEVVAYARVHSVTAAHTRYNVARTSIREWKAQSDQLAQVPLLSLRATMQPLSARNQPIESDYIPPATNQSASEASRSQQSSDGRDQLACASADHGTGEYTSPSRAQPEFIDSRRIDIFTASPSPAATRCEASNFLMIGYQGAAGGFAYTATKRTFSKLLANDALPVPAFEVTGYPQITSMMEALYTGELDFACIESSSLLSSATTLPLDKFVALRLRIVGQVECMEPVSVCGLPGAKLYDADCIMSDWLRLQRYEEFILDLEAQYNTQIHRQVAWDSVLACQLIKEEESEKTLVLCNKQVAIEQGLVVLLDNVEGTIALTRYAIVGRHGTPALSFEASQNARAHNTSRSRCHSTLRLSTTGRGALLDVVSAFAYRDVTVEFLYMYRGEGDSVSTQSSIITYQASPNSVVEEGLQRHLAYAAQEVVHLGSYTTHRL